jgi:serine/threonine-protein kinase
VGVGVVAIEDVSTVSAMGQGAARLPIGTRIGPYEIVGLIGAGGMGVVYRARDPRLRRDVAIKLIPAARQSADAVRRFENEARAAGSINHPNILSVHDVGAGEHGPWIVAELLDGESLRAALKGTLPVEQVLDYALQLATGLAAAHDYGVVHRDLKPENLFVTSDGRLKILDFGIAKFLADDAHPTATGKIIGTPAYMSPEQRAGGEIDQRTDIYSFGTILHELLTGQRVSGTLPAGVPDDLAKLMRDCLQENPKDRPQSARDLVARLRSIRIEPPQRRRVSSAAVAAGLALVAAVSVVGWHYLREWFMQGIQQAAQVSKDPSIAVLPFANLSADAGDAWFADGVHEAILSQLSRLKQLRVISRTSVLQYRDPKRNLREIASALGVGSIVEGSVQRSGDRVRVTTSLIEAATDRTLWTETFDRGRDDLFAIQTAISTRVADALAATLTPGERRALAAVPTTKREAWDLYLRAETFRLSGLYEDLQPAERLYRQALEIDPSFALAMAQLSLVVNDLRWNSIVAGDTGYDEARALAEKALSLRPDLPDAHLALGRFLDHAKNDHAGAEAQFRRALELSPGCAECLAFIGFMQNREGRLEESLATFDRVVQLDPRNEYFLEIRVGRLNDLGKLREALNALDHLLSISARPERLRTFRGFLSWQLTGDRREYDVALAAAPISDEVILARFTNAMIDRRFDNAVDLAKLFKGEAVFGFELPTALLRGQALRGGGQARNAREAFLEARAVCVKHLSEPPLGWRYFLAAADGFLGNADAARSELAAAMAADENYGREIGRVKIHPADGYTRAFSMANAGATDLAIAELARMANEKPKSHITWTDLQLPDWDPLRPDPRFQKIVAQVKPAWAK